MKVEFKDLKPGDIFRSRPGGNIYVVVDFDIFDHDSVIRTRHENAGTCVMSEAGQRFLDDMHVKHVKSCDGDAIQIARQCVTELNETGRASYAMELLMALHDERAAFDDECDCNCGECPAYVNRICGLGDIPPDDRRRLQELLKS